MNFDWGESKTLSIRLLDAQASSLDHIQDCTSMHTWTFGWPFAYLNPLLSEPNSWKVFIFEASLAILDSSMIHLMFFLTLLIALHLQSWALGRLVISNYVDVFVLHALWACGLALTLDPPNYMLAIHAKLSSTCFFINAWGHFFTFMLCDLTSIYFSKNTYVSYKK